MRERAKERDRGREMGVEREEGEMLEKEIEMEEVDREVSERERDWRDLSVRLIGREFSGEARGGGGSHTTVAVRLIIKY